MQNWDNPGETSALLTYEVILTLSYRFRTNTVDHDSLPTPGHRKEHVYIQGCVSPLLPEASKPIGINQRLK